MRAVLGPYWRYSEMVPTLTAPVVLGCSLPGGLHFVRVRAPGPFPLLPEEVHALQSGAPGDQTYCRVLVDRSGFVRDIVCLAKQVSQPHPSRHGH